MMMLSLMLSKLVVLTTVMSSLFIAYRRSPSEVPEPGAWGSELAVLSPVRRRGDGYVCLPVCVLWLFHVLVACTTVQCSPPRTVKGGGRRLLIKKMVLRNLKTCRWGLSRTWNPMGSSVMHVSKDHF